MQWLNAHPPMVTPVPCPQNLVLHNRLASELDGRFLPDI